MIPPKEPKVYFWAYILYNFPWLVIIVVLTIVAVLTAIAFSRPFDLDSGGQSFVPRDNYLAERKDSLLAGLDVTFFSNFTDIIYPPTFVQDPNSVPVPQLFIIFEANEIGWRTTGTTNLLEPAYISEIRRFETLFAERPGFTSYCLKRNGNCTTPLTLTNFFYPPAGQGTTQIPADVALNGTVPRLGVMVDRSFRYPSNIQSSHVQSVYAFGFPLEGFTNTQNNPEDQDSIFKNWIVEQRDFFEYFNENSAYLRVYWIGTGITESDTDRLLVGDAAWAIASILFVLVMLIIHTQSFWLGIWGMIHILLAFPVAYFFVVLPLNVKEFNTLNMLGLFIVIGIGADDIFIFTDRWKVSKFIEGNDTGAKRMAWAFRSASVSMFVTSATTSASFFINAASSIIPIRIFGIFVGLLVVINYLMVLSIYPAVLSIWSYYFEDQCLHKKVRECLGQTEPVVVPKDATEAEREKIEMKQLRIMEKFFYFKYSKFIHYGKIPILLVFLGMFIGLLVVATRLEPAQEPARFLPDTNPLQRAFDLRADAFNNSATISTVNIFFGLSGINRAGTDPNDITDIGQPILDPSFDASSPAAQTYFINVCQQARLENSTLEGQVLCPLEDFRDWLVSNGRPFPSVNFNAEIKEFTDFFAVNSSFPAIARVSGFGGAQIPKTYTSAIRFSSTVPTQLIMLQIIVNTTMPAQAAAPQLKPFLNSWEAFAVRVEANAPPGLRSLTQISDRWITIAIEESLFDNAIFGIWVSMLIAFGVLLITTLNVFLSLIAIVAIGAVVTCVIGTIVSIGWTLGIIESICLTIVVGLSVDYPAHMVESYNEVSSRKGTRFNRTRLSLTRVGISIFFAFISSFVSGCFLLGTEIIFFYKFGIFIILVVFYAIIWALLAVPSMFSLFGPQGMSGNLFWFFRNKPQCCAKRINTDFPDLDEYRATHDCLGRETGKGKTDDGMKTGLFRRDSKSQTTMNTIDL